MFSIIVNARPLRSKHFVSIPFALAIRIHSPLMIRSDHGRFLEENEQYVRHIVGCSKEAKVP
jgi:hypothetical protein